MKLFGFVSSYAVAQAQYPGSMTLEDKITKAIDKCSFYMETAYVCDPPIDKIGKYEHRISKVSASDNSFLLCSGFVWRSSSPGGW